ncbi:MAG TPA: malonic semialdehyde reductase [Vicinamibacterales bacterium]|nr:malonic semialdehyde reductase [Vicinamibacterales bacterium]
MSPQAAVNRLFLEGRTHGHWLDRQVDDDVLRQLYELARMPPTAGNTQPMRLVFVKSADAKARLQPALNPGNVDKVMQAPVTAIVAYDLEFYEHLPKLTPGTDARGRMITRPPDVLERIAFQSGTMQGGYVILAARALGLDCGPIGGFDNAKVDEAFMAGTKWKSNFLLNLGYADHGKVAPRRPRLEFDEACRIL